MVCLTEEFKTENWWEDLDGEQYQTTFRMTKTSVIALQAELQCLYRDDQDSANLQIDNHLLATLWFLGSTEPTSAASTLFSFNESVTQIIESTLQRLLTLGEVYIPWPTDDEANEIEKSFETKHGYQGIIGVLGSLYISINDSNIAQEYYNEQTGENMIVLQAVCDYNMLFRDVCVGCPGSYSVADILVRSPLYSKLTDNDSLLAKNKKHLFGGTQHPELKTLRTPYKGKQLTKKQREFNRLHSSVICIVEDAFKYLKNRFPRLTSVDGLNPQFVSLLVGASCILHNFTRIRNDASELYV